MSKARKHCHTKRHQRNRRPAVNINELPDELITTHAAMLFYGMHLGDLVQGLTVAAVECGMYWWDNCDLDNRFVAERVDELIRLTTLAACIPVGEHGTVPSPMEAHLAAARIEILANELGPWAMTASTGWRDRTTTAGLAVLSASTAVSMCHDPRFDDPDPFIQQAWVDACLATARCAFDLAEEFDGTLEPVGLLTSIMLGPDRSDREAVVQRVRSLIRRGRHLMLADAFDEVVMAAA